MTEQNGPVVSILGRTWEVYPLANGEVHGLVATGIAGAFTQFGSLLYMSTNGWYYKAQNTSGTSVPAVAIAAREATGSADTNALFLLRGIIRNDSWSLTVGDPVYTSSSLGGITSTAPSDYSGQYAQTIGYALASNVLVFDPKLNMTFMSP